MNKKIHLLLTTIILIFMASCTDLTETVYSDIPFDKFFSTEEEVLMNAGRAYTKLQGFPNEFGLWSLTEMASDEMVAPARDDGFVWDNGRWDELHTHQITPTNKILTLAWEFVFEGISACNEVLYETEVSEIEFDGKDRVIAEIKILRSLFYYWAMDNWGNIPFTESFTDKELPEQKDRDFMFSYIIDEINENIGFLQREPLPAYYGRVTKGMAYTLLAKMYLNAEEWIGTPMWEESVVACDSVIAIGAYEISDDYFSNFFVYNENSVENIFVIPNNSVYTKDEFYWYTLTLNDASRQTFDFDGQMWDEFVLEPPFYDKFSEDDIRRSSFLAGQQYDSNGNKIFLIEGSEADTTWFVYTPTIDNYMSRKRWEGARCAKYEYQPGLQYYVTDMENDFVIFRYADVVYTKLEALWRLNLADSYLSDPDVQEIRTRAGLAPYSAGELTAVEFLDELGREFAWEAHRRQDQIRFDVWGDTWWNKPPSGPEAKLFPIPQSILNVNHNLDQNPK